ncbi:MAG: tRNA lysidine(34) synthetase TilS [Halioglobus sp.]
MPDQVLTLDALTDILQPLAAAPRWYVAFSGGCDSTVLLHLLNEYCLAHPKTSPMLTAVHVNHQLQAPSASWQQHCRAVCHSWDVSLVEPVVAVVDDGEGPEAAARRARYSAFDALLQAGDILFMGHHQDDQTETFLLRLLRGAGLHGLAAMPASRELGQGRLERPLLSWPRYQLVDYAHRHQLDWIEDPSNEDERFDRNYLRKQVLPLLAQRWPEYRQTVTRAAGHLGQAAQDLDGSDEPLETEYTIMGDPGFGVASLTDRPTSQAHQALRRWLRARQLPMPDESALVEFVRQLFAADEKAAPVLTTRSFSLRRYREGVFLTPTDVWVAPDAQAIVSRDWVEIAGVGRIAVASEGSADHEGQIAAGELVVDFRRGGERCHPVGRSHSVSLKQLLQENGVPPWWRERIPLLKSQGQIVCIGGMWRCIGPLKEQGEPGVILQWDRNSVGGSD